MLQPKSIAIVGASSDANKLNGRPFHFLRRDGYAGKLYPVNPKYSEIDGVRCYPDIASLPVAPDLAIVAVSKRQATRVIAELGQKGTPVAIIFSSGYSELGEEGAKCERDLLETARKNGIRICGPNTLGLINAFENVTATFSQYADKFPIPGPVAFATQSGAFGTGIAAMARTRGIGLGYFINTGNQADITLVDVLSEIMDDPRISVLCAYIEGLQDGIELIQLAHKAMDAKKPLIITKVGRKAAGVRAAASHTGSLAGEDAVFDGVLRQHGMIRARNEEQLLDLVSAFTCCRAPEGNGIAIITQSGGAGVLMADRAEELGLEVPILNPETRKKLEDVIPSFGSTANPIDVTGQFLAEPKILSESIKITLDDPDINCCIVWLQLMHGYADLLIDVFKDVKASVDKPFIVCWLEAPETALRQLREEGICVIGATERAVDAIDGLVRYGQARARYDGRPPHLFTHQNRQGAGQVRAIPSIKAAQLLKDSGIALVSAELARGPDEAREIADRFGYPVAVKIESPDILHKTEAGGVRLGLSDGESVAESAQEILVAARAYDPDAKIEGVIVQRMAPPATELVLGVRRDPVFGPVVMVGLGGVFVEILEDVAFGAAPISSQQAELMLDGLQGRAILDGVRGKPPVDHHAVIKMICDLSRFALAHPEITELDLNPVFADGNGVVAVDWMMMCEAPE
jgi:acetyltransferase